MRTASIVESRYGSLQPQIKVTFDEGTNYHVKAAEVYRLAAEVELMSQPFMWAIVPNTQEYTVHLELLHATKSEADQGLEVLQRLCS